MCDFPSWIIDDSGKAHWLVDKDITRAIEDGKLSDWNDAVGHSAITKVLGITGTNKEGRKGLPEAFASDIKSGRCMRMIKTEPAGAIKHVWDLVPPLESLEVEGYLDLHGCTGLKALPENLKVEGYLDLHGCTGLKALPENLKVGGYLYLDGCTGLKALPENLKVGGDLYLYGCTGLKALPENLKVGGYLSLGGCTGLTALPENLKVGGGLSLGGCTGLKALPENLEKNVKGMIYR